jgi:hypothetical protein
MNLTDFSLLANSSAGTNENQEMEVTIGSLSIFIGPSGSTRLSDSVKPDPSASEPETVAMMEYFEGSSSEVNSPVSLGEVQERKIAEGDETVENFDLGIQLEDLVICHDNILDKSTDTWKTGLELYEDDDSIFSSFNNKIGKQCQVLAIVGDNSEEFNENNNPVLNPANIDRGANHLAEGQTTEFLATREKIRLSADEWRVIRAAVVHGTPIPSNSSKNMLLGYHYALRQQAKQLAKDKIEIQQRKESAIAANNAAHRARSDASHTNANRNRRHGSRYENLEYSERQSISKNLDLSFLSVDEQGNIIPKTPEAALVVAQAYLFTTRPSPGDPREHMHRAVLNGLKMVDNKLSAKEEEAYHKKETHKPRSPRHHNSPRRRSSSQRSRSPSAKQLGSPKHGGTRRSRSPHRRHGYKDDKKEMGASCFTRRVRTTPVPKGFKLPHDQQKYDGSQEPQSGLSDYLQVVQILGGTKETAMQSLELHLTSAARSWLSKLEKETIGSWQDLTKQFTNNFRSSYKRPTSIEEVKACVQQHGETLRAYIQRWSLIKNLPVEVSDKRAIDAFIIGLRRGDLVEEMGRIKPKIVSDLMDVANRFADGEDACNNKRT